LNTELLISCDDWENRVAVLEEGSLAEIYFEREEKVIGSIYKGRVENVLPGMGACFVNIGLGRNAFLYVDDIRRDPINIGETEITDRRKGHTVNELLKVGDDVLVQIVKEPRGLKGARVSTNISLPGRYLVLMPTGRYSGVSSRVEDDRERERLKQVMRRVRPEGMATIVRTAARGVSEAELIADLGVQLRLWHGILESYKRSSAPALLHKDLNLVFKAVRDFMTSDVRQVVIDSKEQYDEIRSTMSLLGPQYLSRLKLWEGPGDLFETRGIDEELQKLLKPKIVLPSGGYLILEHTEALTVIDVNTGKFTGGRNLEDTLVRTNIEAAAEIARQVRLRDIGGIIVVDFIDMAHERSRQQVIDTLGEALKRDRTRSTIQAFSNLGLLEFTRKRVGKDLAGQLRSDCPYCTGLGDVMSSESLAISLLRKIQQKGQNGSRGRKLDLIVDPSVATQLVGWYREELEKLRKSLGIDIQLFVDPQRHRETITLENSHRSRRPLTAGRELEVDLLSVRLPDPASGVAVHESNIIEVKDAANGAGSMAKIKVTAVDGDLAKAELAEPLQTGQRRRRRGRGRGKAAVETEAPIAPPTPKQAPDEEREPAARRRDQEREEPARPAAAARRRELPLAYGIDEEDEEDYTLRGGRVAGGSVGAGSSGRGRSAQTEPRRRDEGRGDRKRERSRSGGRTPMHPQAMIVGGEGDIDYEDDEDSVTVMPSQAATRVPSRSRTGTDNGERPSEDEEEATRRRRRRRGGRGRGGDEDRLSAESDRLDEDTDDREETTVRGRAPAGTRDRGDRGRVERPRHDERPTRERERPRDEREARSERDRDRGRESRVEREPVRDRDRDGRREREPRIQRDREPRREREPRAELDREPRMDRDRERVREPRSERGHVDDERDERPRRREQRQYGAIQPLYGKPLEIEAERPADKPLREDRPSSSRRIEETRGREDRDDRRPRRDEGRGSSRSREDRPEPRGGHRAPAAFDDEEDLDVVIDAGAPEVIDVEIMPSDRVSPRRPREQSEGDEDRKRGEHRDRPRRDRDGDRGERDGRGDRGPRRGGRDRAPAEPRIPRPVKQLYPPPGTEEELAPEGMPKALPFASRRTPRGPMMREPGAEPPPKGKVRQLYPPPPFDEEYVEENGAPAPAPPQREPERAELDSMFVSGAAELEGRRRLARERADARRSEPGEPVSDEATSIRPPFSSPFDEDEE